MTDVLSPKGPIQSVAIAISWGVSTAVALVATRLLLEVTKASYDVWIVFVASPLLLGILQWGVLRWLLPKAWWWVVQTSIGSALGWACSLGMFFVAGMLADATPTYLLNWIPDGAFCGFVAAAGGVGIGVAQWNYLRRYVRRAGWWVLGSAIALGIGAGPNLCAGMAMYGVHNWLLKLAVGGLTGGAIKGGTLVWLLRKPKTVEANL